MGTWAEGNFDSDSAGDFVADIAKEVAKELAPPEEVEEIELVMAAVAMTRVLVEHCHAPRPDRGTIESLRDEVLALFDENFDALDPAPGFKVARRAVIVQTFAELLALIEE